MPAVRKSRSQAGMTPTERLRQRTLTDPKFYQALGSSTALPESSLSQRCLSSNRALRAGRRDASYYIDSSSQRVVEGVEADRLD